MDLAMTTVQHLELADIRKLHDRAEAKAYELGRFDHAEGVSLNAHPKDFCAELVRVWTDGWNDEQAGKP